jgi:hypothetical protein
MFIEFYYPMRVVASRAYLTMYPYVDKICTSTSVKNFTLSRDPAGAREC